MGLGIGNVGGFEKYRRTATRGTVTKLHFLFVLFAALGFVVVPVLHAPIAQAEVFGG